MPEPERIESDALRRFADGAECDSAFEAALPELDRLIKKYLVYFGIRAASLEEVAQEAVVRVYLNRATLCGKGSAVVLSWIRTTCRNLQVDFVRQGIRQLGRQAGGGAHGERARRRARSGSGGRKPLEAMPSLPDDPELREVLELCIDRLPERKRAIIELKYLLDLPTSDITVLLDRGARLVQTELKGARESLADCLRHHGYEVET